CIAGFPYLNNLIKQYASEDIAFISLSEEDVARVKASLNKHSLLAYNLIDRNGETFKAFGIESLPATYFIDKEGKIRWKGYYSELTNSVLDSLLGRKKENNLKEVPLETKGSLNLMQKKELTSPIQFSLQLSSDQSIKDFGVSLSNKNDKKNYGWKAKTWSLANFLALQLNSVSPTHVVFENGFEDKNIDLDYTVSKDWAADPKHLLQSILEQTFNIKTQKIERASKVYELVIVNEKLLQESKTLQPEDGKRSWIRNIDQKNFVFINQDLSTLAKALEFRYKKILVGDILPKKFFDITLIDLENFEEQNNYLEKKYGIKFIETTKSVEMFSISKQ
ncbi:MAG TPA: TlpA disulfide reductase family protein, partial [Chondromyces sp.]|nr:TlpA disulfide reductase family protein [Chondromyces sp.]